MKLKLHLMLSVLALLFFPCLSKAQFIVTPGGLTTENGKDYVVITIEGKDKATLYQEALKHITKSYVSAKDVVSSVENEMISTNGTFHISDGIVKYNVNYTINLEFRDGRVKYSLPIIHYMKGYFDGSEYQLTYNESNGGFGSVVRVGIYTKKGELKKKGKIFKNSIEAFFNTDLNTLQEALSENDEDW